MKKKKEYLCTFCGGDATVSFQGMYDKNDFNQKGIKNSFKKKDRPCLSCCRKMTGDKII